MADLVPDDVFRLHPSIRWAGLASERAGAIFSKMRPGLKSLSPEKEDLSFMELNPQLIIGACDRLSAWAGEVNSVAIEYEKVIMYLVRHNAKILALTIERKSNSPDIITEMAPSIRQLLE